MCLSDIWQTLERSKQTLMVWTRECCGEDMLPILEEILPDQGQDLGIRQPLLAFGFDFSLLFSSRDLFFPFLVMKIKVNNSHYVEVDPSDTIWSLKCAIYSKRIRGHNGKLLPPPDDQRLVDRATQAVLSDCGKTLEFYGIHEGSSIKCELIRCSEEDGFRRLLDVSRKKERTSLKVGVHDGLTMSFCTCIKHLCWHAHELGMMVYLSESHLLHEITDLQSKACALLFLVCALLRNTLFV